MKTESIFLIPNKLTVSAYDNLGDFQKGIECFDKRLEINPNNVASWNNKAYALIQLKKYGEALECFDRALLMRKQHSRIDRLWGGEFTLTGLVIVILIIVVYTLLQSAQSEMPFSQSARCS